MKQENSRWDSRKSTAGIGKLPTPVLSGSGSRVSLSPTLVEHPCFNNLIETLAAGKCKWAMPIPASRKPGIFYLPSAYPPQPGFTIVPSWFCAVELRPDLCFVTAVTYGILDSASLKSDLGGLQGYDAILSRCRSNSHSRADMAVQAAAYRDAVAALCRRGDAAGRAAAGGSAQPLPRLAAVAWSPRGRWRAG